MLARFGVLLFCIFFSLNAWCAGPFFQRARLRCTPGRVRSFNGRVPRGYPGGEGGRWGTVFVPPGTYVMEPVEMVSNLTLYIDAGATLKFPAQRLPYTKGRQQGIECLTPVPLIGGHDLENVTITGRGVLMSDNADWMKMMPRRQASGDDPGSANGPNWEKLLKDLEVKAPRPEEEYERVAPELRPSFVRFMNSENVLVEGLRFIGSPMWTIHLLYTNNAVVRNVVIETYPGVHTDGIAVDSSRNVRISDSYIDTGDDGIVIKSGKDADGRRVNRPTEGVSITNVTVAHAHGAVTIGSEISGGIRNLVASNITCKGTQIGVRIKSRRGRGGYVEDVRFNNWTMEDVGTGIEVTSYYLMEGEKETAEEPVSVRTPIFRNIAISNMTIHGAKVPINIEGLPEMPIQGLRLTDVIVSGKVGMKGAYADGLELHNVQVNSDDGPAFRVHDSKDLELDAVSSRKPLAGSPVVRLDRCDGAILRNSRAVAGTGTFLSVAPGELKNIVLQDNALAGAQQATKEEGEGTAAAK